MSINLLVVGASAGGVAALGSLVRGLPASFNAAVLVVLHTSADGPYMLPEILSNAGVLRAEKVADGEPIEHGRIYVAPPDKHLLVGEGRISLSRGPKENRARPAIDPLFRTAAAACGARVVGLILTGMLNDGTAGLKAVKECGGIAVVQHPRDARYSQMPLSALTHVAVDHVAPLAKLPALLMRLVKNLPATSANRTVSKRIEIESRYDRMESMRADSIDAIGSRAGLSCPECGGPLWKIQDGTLLRYRCHVGHAYTAEIVAADQIQAEETYLWQALRLMKERVSLMRELDRAARTDAKPARGAPHRAAIAQLEKNIKLIQQIIEHERPAAA